MDPKGADEDRRDADAAPAAAGGFDPCASVRPHFSDRLDGQAIPFPASLLVRFHLAVCPPCRRVHRSLVATRDALVALRDADVSLDTDTDEGQPEPGKESMQRS